ncbi:MAG: zinc ribbon-containing protein [Bacillales bacterium]
MTQPTIEEVITKLKMVLEGKLTREEAASWAMEYVRDDSLAFDINRRDEKLWDLLCCGI